MEGNVFSGRIWLGLIDRYWGEIEDEIVARKGRFQDFGKLGVIGGGFYLEGNVARDKWEARKLRGGNGSGILRENTIEVQLETGNLTGDFELLQDG